jgi:hypothetical protein
VIFAKGPIQVVNFASVLRESRNDEHPVEMLVGIMDVEMGRTVDEADAAADEAVEDSLELTLTEADC